MKRFCTTDYQVLCKGVPIGAGRVINCLASNQPALSPELQGRDGEDPVIRVAQVAAPAI